ncbi:DUF262 domain-containing protein [Duffyella gerundensis]|uniref:DUF262 domain-containing protein n=1 Tax=Duffyella gerundensis TaxID=1619313 RepID=UPI001654832A|nr:DUF262 domain-containing protein [Duffyella gerundensis]
MNDSERDIELNDEDIFEELDVLNNSVPSSATDKTIEKHFATGRLRVIQDKNDFFLPHVLDFIEGRSWGNLNPEYQRRLRWDNAKKSKLIESFIMNVPVPPVFLYEENIGKFEVMDGQQRLNAVVDFFKGRFELSGLKIWPSLNGRNFSKLPPLIRKGLERAKISAITLMSDSSETEANALDLRAQVFERLNTGGERLNAQELRNSLYSGKFNQMLIKLAKNDIFTTAWDIPKHSENILSDGSPTETLKKNSLYRKMTDVEIVLRFFAFKDDEYISGSVRSMLDRTMMRNIHISDEEIEACKNDFIFTLNLVTNLLEDSAFRVYHTTENKPPQLSRPLYDAQMIAAYQLKHRSEEILDKSHKIKKRILQVTTPESSHYELIIGRANTSSALKERITFVKGIIEEVLDEKN